VLKDPLIDYDIFWAVARVAFAGRWRRLGEIDDTTEVGGAGSTRLWPRNCDCRREGEGEAGGPAPACVDLPCTYVRCRGDECTLVLASAAGRQAIEHRPVANKKLDEPLLN
jgi:hypothetical protein